MNQKNELRDKASSVNPEFIFKLFRFLAKKSDLRLRQLSQVFRDGSHAKKGGCVGSLPIDSHREKIIMSGVGARVQLRESSRTWCFLMQEEQWTTQLII